MHLLLWITHEKQTFSWTIILLVVVHLCPAVPTQANTEAWITMSRSASSATIIALLPPNSSRDLPNLFWTSIPTWSPTLVLPVNDTRGSRVSLAIAEPMSAPPQTREQMAPGRLFRWWKNGFTLELALNLKTSQ